MESSTYFREKAAQCRRLAKVILTKNDPAIAALLALADEFDARAAALTAREKAARAIGLGDDVVPPPEDRGPEGTG